MVTLAPATTPPLMSVTVPKSVALTACEKAEPALQAASTKRRKIERRSCIELTPLVRVCDPRQNLGPVKLTSALIIKRGASRCTQGQNSWPQLSDTLVHLRNCRPW